VDLEKIKAIMEWSVPKGVSDICSFMGITRYYRRFIKGFSRIVYPITSLQKKIMKFNWSQKCQDSFDKLKRLLTTTPILKVANLDKYFTIFIYASKEGHFNCY
jgi:hypothetical protein